MKPIYVQVPVTKKKNENNRQVPIVVGKNIIRLCKEYANSVDANIRKKEVLAVTILNISYDIPVKTTIKYSITVQEMI